MSYASFAHTTLSHTLATPKARVGLITDAPFTDADYYRRAKRAVIARLLWGDAAVHDHSRLFYGTHPERGQTRFLGNVLPLAVVDRLIEEHQADLKAEDHRRELPRIPSSRIMGCTPAERYVSAAIQSETAWLSCQVKRVRESATRGYSSLR